MPQSEHQLTQKIRQSTARQITLLLENHRDSSDLTRKKTFDTFFANLKMMAVRYHGCTCHLRYSAAANQNQNQNSVKKGSDNSNTSGKNLFLWSIFYSINN